MCLLIGGFNPFTLRVITNRGGLTIAIFTVFCMFFSLSVSLSRSYCLILCFETFFFFCSDESLGRLKKDSNN